MPLHVLHSIQVVEYQKDGYLAKKLDHPLEMKESKQKSHHILILRFL